MSALVLNAHFHFPPVVEQNDIWPAAARVDDRWRSPTFAERRLNGAAPVWAKALMQPLAAHGPEGAGRENVDTAD